MLAYRVESLTRAGQERNRVDRAYGGIRITKQGLVCGGGGGVEGVGVR